MKGIVFTEFLEMVEKKFGYEMVDTIIEKSELESEGIYTAIGTYDHSEIVQLIIHLSSETNIDVETLIKEFGRYIFDAFLNNYPMFFDASPNALEFLKSIDSYIHVEVNKLYPDATLPSFATEIKDDGSMEMIYRSERKMSSLAFGLIERTLEYYDEEYTVSREFLNEDGSRVKFTISPA
ncbi:MAG: heme NO-binding domain-containing protein [Balneolales bacterium]|nr:heme NO-binding domain-containing protein [Balneolales bacterium]